MACSSGNESNALVFCTIKQREVFSVEKFHCFMCVKAALDGGGSLVTESGRFNRPTQINFIHSAAPL